MYGFLAVMIAAAFWDNLSAPLAMPGACCDGTARFAAAGPTCMVVLSLARATEGLRWFRLFGRPWPSGSGLSEWLCAAPSVIIERVLIEQVRVACQGSW